MADCQKHYHCVQAADYRPVEAATLAISAVIFGVISGIGGNPLGGAISGALWIAAVFDLCRYLSGGKLICHDLKVCVIGRLVKLIPVGADKSGFEKMDDDYTFNIVMSPHASTESISAIAATDRHQAKYIQRQPGPDSLGLGYVGESVKFTNIPADTEVLHCEIKGCRVHDVCIVLKVMSFPTAAAAIICSIPVIGWIACLIAFAVVLALTAIIGGIVWAATHNGEMSDVLDPASGTLNPADPDTGLGGDIILIRGDWVYDAGHDGWNEIHPVRYVQKLEIPNEYHGTDPADTALVERFKAEVLDPWCFEVGRTDDPLIRGEQEKPENAWHIHPAIDGCRERQPIG
jgi:hypothetical protein